MQVDISYNDDKNGIELLFSEKLSENMKSYLKKIGFKETLRQPLKWCATRTPAYTKYANDLKETLLKGEPFENALIAPSYDPSEENIDHNKFSYVTISFLKDGDKEQESFVVFDPFKRVATEIGRRYAEEKYGDSFKEIDVSPRNYKRKARTLLNEGKFVTGDPLPNQDNKIPENVVPVKLDQKRKFELLTEFREFSEKRKSDFPEIEIEDHELPIQFSSWLRENHPDLINQKDSIWEEYPAIQNTPHSDGDEHKETKHPYTIALKPYPEFVNAKDFAGQLMEQDDPYGYEDNKEQWESEDAGLWKLTEIPFNQIPQNDIKEMIDFSQEAVDFWEDKIREGAKPPIMLLHRDGSISNIADGKHKLLAYEKLKFEQIPAIVGSLSKDPIFLKYKDWYDENKHHALSNFEKTDDYVYQDFNEFEADVIYQMELEGELTTSDAQGILMVPSNESYVADQWTELSVVTPKNAKEVASSLLNTEHPPNSNSKKIERLFSSALKNVPSNKVYQDYEEFESQVLYLLEKLGEKPQYEAQQILIQPGNQEYVEKQFNQIEKATPRDAKNTALVLLERPSIKVENKPIDPLTNSNGVYTKKTAGDNIETILVDLPATSKVEIEIRIAKGSDGLFRYGLNVQKNFGDHSGGGSFPSISDPTFDTRLEALKSALGETLDTLNGMHKSEDYILSNEEKKRKLIQKAIVALTAYSKSVFETEERQTTPPVAAKAIAVDIESRGVTVPNVLTPALSKEPFISGNIYLANRQNIKKASPDLWQKKDSDLSTASAIDLFELSQLPHPKEYGIDVTRGNLLDIWVEKGERLLTELGFPADKNYPYVNIHTGYKSVDTLEDILGERGESWWSVVEHYRPIADLDKAVSFIEDEVKKADRDRQEFINPKTKKPTAKNKEEYNKLTWLIESLEAGKEIIKDYLSAKDKKEAPKEKPELPPSDSDDYMDRVIAHMHDEYELGKRVTKGQIEKLAIQLKVPNMGKMWEAVELSWLLWYKMLYNEHSPFERRLAKMIVFWHKIQPTYAYSDSSKEIYKQYSTPCPIAAIIAQYTLMGQAQNIFEPSAGNGLLVLGADPKKTHVNEIDKTRLESLRHQEFKKITSLNAAQPFPEEMTKAYDVVVTNPPFAKWEDEKFDKDYIIGKYFHNHIGLAGNIRLEHLMAGLALHTMKDTGRAAIIIMGHVYFDKDTFIAKYRPFFNWLYRHYQVDDVINMNSFKLYNKQGAIEKTMLILIGGRKATPKGVSPTSIVAPHLYGMVNSFEELWQRVSPHISYNINTVIKQLKIELGQ